MADMIGAFKFNGVSSQSFDLVSKSIKRPLLPPAKVKRVELPAASGVYDFNDLEYGIRQITMRIIYIGKNYYELRQRARRIAAWLSSPTWSSLILDDEQELYYLAKVTSELDLDNLWQSGSIDVEFDCQPFAYSVTEEIKQFSGSGGSFTNPGTREINYKSPQGSKFTITAIGSNIWLSINGRAITYSGSGTLILDNINMEATVDGANVFHSLSGDIDTFFKIVPGNNAIAATGASSITVNYIPMWM